MPKKTTFDRIPSVIRHLHGPGPSDVYPTVLEAIALPVVGHLDPAFIQIMEEVKEQLRSVFETSNTYTLPISGTGSAGMEAAVFNTVEPGDRVLVCINGFFGTRIAEMARRCGGEVDVLTVAWGEAFEPGMIRDHLLSSPADVVCIVHAETSTGVLQPLQEISTVVHEHGALLLVDAVTSLGGMPVELDHHQVDVCYSGTQKCLSCPPGLAPISFNDRAMEKITSRKTKVQSWYLDMSLLISYWGGTRAYHHTAPISMNYALHEALRTILEEGLPACFQRHRLNQAALTAGLKALGLEPFVSEPLRLPNLITVKVPEGLDEAMTRKSLLTNHQIEIGGGLGDLKGTIWRLGIMGYSSRREAVLRLLAALEDVLSQQDWSFSPGAALAAAKERYE